MSITGRVHSMMWNGYGGMCIESVKGVCAFKAKALAMLKLQFFFCCLLKRQAVSNKVFYTSPFHSTVDGLQSLYKEFPEVSILDEALRRGVDLYSDGAKPVADVHVRVRGKGFHRELSYVVNDVLFDSAVAVFIFQRLKPDVYVDPYELRDRKSLKEQAIDAVVAGPIDLELPAPSSRTTLLVLQGKIEVNKKQVV